MNNVVLVHSIAAYIIFALLILRAFPILLQGRFIENSSVSNKILVGLQHLGYSVLLLSGAWLLWQSQFQVETWFYAKIILFFAMLSASVKAFRRRGDIQLIQRRAGLVIALIAYCCIFALVYFKA